MYQERSKLRFEYRQRLMEAKRQYLFQTRALKQGRDPWSDMNDEDRLHEKLIAFSQHSTIISTYFRPRLSKTTYCQNDYKILINKLSSKNIIEHYQSLSCLRNLLNDQTKDQLTIKMLKFGIAPHLYNLFSKYDNPYIQLESAKLLMFFADRLAPNAQRLIRPFSIPFAGIKVLMKSKNHLIVMMGLKFLHYQTEQLNFMIPTTDQNASILENIRNHDLFLIVDLLQSIDISLLRKNQFEKKLFSYLIEIVEKEEVEEEKIKSVSKIFGWIENNFSCQQTRIKLYNQKNINSQLFNFLEKLIFSELDSATFSRNQWKMFVTQFLMDLANSKLPHRRQILNQLQNKFRSDNRSTTFILVCCEFCKQLVTANSPLAYNIVRNQFILSRIKKYYQSSSKKATKVINSFVLTLLSMPLQSRHNNILNILKRYQLLDIYISQSGKHDKLTTKTAMNNLMKLLKQIQRKQQQSSKFEIVMTIVMKPQNFSRIEEMLQTNQLDSILEEYRNLKNIHQNRLRENVIDLDQD